MLVDPITAVRVGNEASLRVLHKADFTEVARTPAYHELWRPAP